MLIAECKKTIGLLLRCSDLTIQNGFGKGGVDFLKRILRG
jgi:hypothetical protein